MKWTQGINRLRKKGNIRARDPLIIVPIKILMIPFAIIAGVLTVTGIPGLEYIGFKILEGYFEIWNFLYKRNNDVIMALRRLTGR